MNIFCLCLKGTYTPSSSLGLEAYYIGFFRKQHLELQEFSSLIFKSLFLGVSKDFLPLEEESDVAPARVALLHLINWSLCEIIFELKFHFQNKNYKNCFSVS